MNVIIPACNEAAHLEKAVGMHLETAYPDVEFMLVDDRSTDGPSRIIDRLAEMDTRICPVHIDALPESWLCRVFAEHTGQSKAAGGRVWLADDPDTIQTAGFGTFLLKPIQNLMNIDQFVDT